MARSGWYGCSADGMGTIVLILIDNCSYCRAVTGEFDRTHATGKATLATPLQVVRWSPNYRQNNPANFLAIYTTVSMLSAEQPYHLDVPKK
jgi:hypothetical protein